VDRGGGGHPRSPLRNLGVAILFLARAGDAVGHFIKLEILDMMNTRTLSLLSAMLIGVGGPALAQQATDQAQNQPPAEENADQLRTDGTIAEEMRMPSRSVTTSGDPYAGTVFGAMQADDVIGMTVVDAEGSSVGEVADLLIGTDNEIDRAIVDVGGFLGFGAKPVAIDIDELLVAEGADEIILDVTREELESMPEWQSSEEGWFTD
jgi:sporulation protein YlmC with PRC-barrel domain